MRALRSGLQLDVSGEQLLSKCSAFAARHEGGQLGAGQIVASIGAGKVANEVVESGGHCPDFGLGEHRGLLGFADLAALRGLAGWIHITVNTDGDAATG